jgi:hypothetical protein
VGVAPSAVDGVFLYVRSGDVVRHEDLPGEEELAALLRGTGVVEVEPLTLL